MTGSNSHHDVQLLDAARFRAELDGKPVALYSLRNSKGMQARISSWYGHDSLAEARSSTAFSLRVLRVMATLRDQLPPDACVSLTMAEIFMLHSRRYSRPPPSQREPLTRLRAALADCPYVLLLDATAFPAADFPPFYPTARLAGELEALYTAPRDAAVPGGPPLAILARYHGAAQTLPSD